MPPAPAPRNLVPRGQPFLPPRRTPPRPLPDFSTVWKKTAIFSTQWKNILRFFHTMENPAAAVPRRGKPGTRRLWSRPGLLALVFQADVVAGMQQFMGFAAEGRPEEIPVEFFNHGVFVRAAEGALFVVAVDARRAPGADLVGGAVRLAAAADAAPR